MEEIEVIRETLNKLSSKYRKLETENKNLKEKIESNQLLEKEIKDLNRTIKYKDKKIECLKARITKKMKYSKKYKWDDECLYVRTCIKRNIKQCDKCKETGEYIGGKYGREVKGIQW